jgi:hypothetical protein
MCSVSKALLGVIVVLAGSLAFADPQELWVCADRNNLPYSNDRQQGFENKLAQMVAVDLGRKLDVCAQDFSPWCVRHHHGRAFEGL